LKKEELVQLLGNANEFKEGDLSVGVGTDDDVCRADAKQTLSRVRLIDIFSCDIIEDQLTEKLKYRFTAHGSSADALSRIKNQTVGEIRNVLVRARNPQIIKTLGNGMTSEMIAAVAKVMTNEQLIEVCAAVFNPQNGSGSVGSAGCFGSRIQPNSPTDDPTEILYSVFEGLSYGCGDVIIGVNPANDTLDEVIALENTLAAVIEGLGLPTRWSVLSDIKKQHEALTRGARIDVGFQSLAGTSKALHGMLECEIDELIKHFESFNGLYFETGQGSEFTNGADAGIDMVTLESRTYGLARFLKTTLPKWMIVNDVAGFIGPEVFRTEEQLVRACLEDLFMGKLHGLTMGLDICSTYHMGIAPAALDRITQTVAQAAPAYLMAVAGKSDPMLGYLTTDFRSHPKLRRMFGKFVTRSMSKRLTDIGIMRADGTLTEHAGDLIPVARNYGEDPVEITKTIRRLQQRGMDIGYGCSGDFAPPVHVQKRLEDVFRHARLALYREIAPGTMQISQKPFLKVHTKSRDRDNYIAEPTTGEKINPNQIGSLKALYRQNLPKAQIVISDGLNADAVNENLKDLLPPLKFHLQDRGISSGRDIYVHNGRVRAGYHIGAILGIQLVVHLIGERPGTGTNNLSAYITYGLSPEGALRWETIEHANTTALCSINRRIGVKPVEAALRIAKLAELMMEYKCSGVSLLPYLGELDVK
jgi:ethanolamine ammonia-lyase large subunit